MPSLGAPTPTGYIYLEMLYSDVKQNPPTFGPFASPEPIYSIEHYIVGRCIIADIKALIDGSRVYRFPNTMLNLFQEDKCNPGQYFLPVANKRFLILSTDPSLTKAIRYDWVPVY